MKVIWLSMLVMVCLAGSASAECPVGDLSGNRTVDWEDLLIFVSQYLDSGTPASDLNGLDGVNLADFALLAKNWQQSCPATLLINEFMTKNESFVQDDDNDYDDWIEIYNYGDEAIDIAGMYLSDNLSLLTRWQVPATDPAATTIAPGGYLLIWADTETSEGVLHANFGLSAAGGEDVVLFDPDLGIIDSIAGFGSQAADNSYGRLPNGADTWQNFIHDSGMPPTPLQINGLGFDDNKIMISEIMYHPYHRLYDPYYEAEGTNEEYIELYNSSGNSVDLQGWQFIDGIDFTFTGSSTIAPGGYLVVAADVGAFTAKYPSVTNFVGSWAGRLSNSGEKIELVNNNGVMIDSVRYSDEGNWAVRQRGPLDTNHNGWIWSDEHDGDGKSLELINPAVSNKYGQNWAASTVAAGTPGAANSAASADIAPLILSVSHFPVIPRSTDVVTVTARIVDELATGISVVLYYRTDVNYGQPPNAFSTVTMFDDGLHNDTAASDGIYGALIPTHPNEVVIEYYVQATDAGANSRTYPAAAQPGDQQVANALYQVDDSFDAIAQQAPGARPLYNIIMTDAERYELLVQIGNGGPDKSSNAQMNATFISVDGTEIRTRYNVGVRIRGSGSRADAPMNFKVNFRHDRSWKGVTAININSRMPHAQLVGSALCRNAGLAAAVATLVETRVNSQIPPSPSSSWLGTYVCLEATDSDFADDHFPGDGNGNIYKCMHAGDYADLRYEGPDAIAYRDTYFKQTNESQDDFADLISLTNALSNSPDSTYVEDVLLVVDVNQWMRWFAAQSLIGNVERGLANGAGDDYCMYRGMVDTRFVLLPYDLDSLRAIGEEGFDWTSPSKTNDSIWKATRVDAIDRFLTHPDFVDLYYAAFHDLISTSFSPSQLDPIVDAQLTGFAPQWLIDEIKEYFVDRNAYVLSVIP